jgi:hypothetical protein
VKRYYIVWNSDKSEGVIFDNKTDAALTAKGYESIEKVLKRGGGVTALGEAFAEMQEDPMTLEEFDYHADEKDVV